MDTKERAPNGDYKIGPIEWGPRRYGLKGGAYKCAEKHAELWGVYLRARGGLASWRADFHTRADCELFVGALVIRDNARSKS